MRDQIVEALSEQGTPFQISGDEMKLPCPECGDHRSQKMKLCFNTAKQVGHCWVCESRFSLARLVQAFNLTGIRVKSSKGVSSTFKRFASLRTMMAREAKPVKLPERRPLSQYPSALKYVLDRDVSRSAIKLFGLAVCSDDFDAAFYGRVVIPVKNQKGLIVTYLGRTINPFQNPKYMLHSVPVGDFLYGANLIKNHTTAVLFEGTFSVIRTYHKLKEAFGSDVVPVASFSHHLSIQQERVLQECGVSKVIIFYDGDSIEISKKLESRLKKWARVARVELDDLQQPDDLTPDDIVSRIAVFVEDLRQTRVQRFSQQFAAKELR